MSLAPTTLKAGGADAGVIDGVCMLPPPPPPPTCEAAFLVEPTAAFTALKTLAPVAIAVNIKGILKGGGAVFAAFATEPETSAVASEPVTIVSDTAFLAFAIEDLAFKINSFANNNCLAKSNALPNAVVSPAN